MTTLDYETYEKKFKDVTLPHFVSGISAILSFANSAVTLGDKELEESECVKVKMDVGLAYEEISMAKEGATGMIDSLTAETLQLTEEFDKAQVDRKNLEESLWLKKDELITLESRRYQVNDQLQAARLSLQHTEDALNIAEARKGEKATGRDMGIGLMLLVPCVGIPMTVDYNKELNNTKRLVKTVEGEMHRLRAIVKQNEEEMKKCNSQIPEISKEIERVKESLTRREREVEKMQRACGILADIKCKLKYCYNYLYSLHGTVEVLYTSCRDIYNLDSIMSVIEETFRTIQQQNSHNELLVYDANVQKMVKELKAIQYRMNIK
ncbi:chromosome partition protein Smc-like isoform X2 [Heterodontus francisci]|uniref:chromosome partition protein Smc-like isoform X2 n=1 Tax=Heterodontus francisci TaxID=7792 RepID=UPI00355B41DC